MKSREVKEQAAKVTVVLLLSFLVLPLGVRVAASNDEISMLNLGITEEESVSRGTLNCNSPIILQCGVPYNGNTSGQPNNVNSYNCSGWNESGPEMVHRIYANTNGVMHVTVSNMPVDLDVFLLNPCDENYCLTYGDDYFDWNMVAGTYYYIVVDGYGGNVSTYTLNATCATYTPTLTPTIVPTSTSTPTTQPSITPSLTPSPTASASPTMSPTRTPTSTLSPTSTPTWTPTPTGSMTTGPTRTPTTTPTPQPIPAVTPIGALTTALVIGLFMMTSGLARRRK